MPNTQKLSCTIFLGFAATKDWHVFRDYMKSHYPTQVTVEFCRDYSYRGAIDPYPQCVRVRCTEEMRDEVINIGCDSYGGNFALQ